MENDDRGAMEGPTVLGEVVLVKCPARGYPKQLHELANFIGTPDLSALIQQFLYQQLHPKLNLSLAEIDADDYPQFEDRVSVFLSVVTMYYAPSDQSGVSGMYRECIRSVPSW
ncbi:hypothetical protein SCP_1503250 [Sparassis crispa]|uniref:Uncharacterized protein n=1 Tax=Sparassis crispa TaxID=139825 RepID=A0A401H4F7_9APHY|nr:hypothetical protein SCP_1503250 [Sparassis crispa]GBE89317.1 hypothetical protein SCP_1503250 [Sparassis crispa]